MIFLKKYNLYDFFKCNAYIKFDYREMKVYETMKKLSFHSTY